MARRSKSPLRWIARLLASGFAAALAFEGCVRWLAFAPGGANLAERFDLRRPELFAHPVEDLYWVLQTDFALAAGAELVAVPGYDSELGWTGGVVRRATDSPGPWAHPDEVQGDARRTVLLYGDSFSACASPRGTCFQDHLERAPEGAAYRLLNHGVGGYGLDQALLMLERTLDRHPEAAIAFGLLVDDDLDRCALSYRSWPKPRFERTSAGFVAREAAAGRPEPPLAAWYGLRLLLHGTALERTAVHRGSCSLRRIDERNRERCRFLIERLAERLEGREAFCVLFFGERTLAQPERNGWREAGLRSWLDEAGLPWVSTRGPLLAHARASGREVGEYFLANGHLSSLGNQVALRAITEGLAGRYGEAARADFDARELFGTLAPDRIAEVVLGGPQAAARYEYGFRQPFGRVEADRSRLCFRAGVEGPTSVRYELGGLARSFRATAKFIPVGELGPGEGSVLLELEADGEQLTGARLTRGDELELDVELSGRSSLVISVGDAGDGARGDWLYLASPRFE